MYKRFNVSGAKEPLISLPSSLPQPRQIGAFGDEDDLIPSTPSSQQPKLKEGAQCKTLLITLGALAFIVSLASIGVISWRFFTVQDDLSRLSVRLRTAELLLVNHTTRLGSLNTTLLATTARSLFNSMNIALLNDTQIIDEERITSLENRTDHVEIRLTAAEIKLIATMNDVMTLQTQMTQAQTDIIEIMAEVTILQQNASDHALRITALEVANIQNQLNIQNLFTWLQTNLTYIDARLSALNTSYVVTAQGTAQLESGPAAPVPVRWETRRVHATGGFDVEYLWISDSAFTPIQVKRFCIYLKRIFFDNSRRFSLVQAMQHTALELPTLLPLHPSLHYQRYQHHWLDHCQHINAASLV